MVTSPQDDRIQPGCVSWVRILGARTSGPHVFKFHGGHPAAAAGPALTAVSARHFISKRLWRRGHADILGARTSGPHVFTFHRGQSAATPGPGLTAVSARHFISKRLCAPGTCGHPGCADLRSACLHLSPWPISSNTRPGADSSLCAPFYFKAALRAGDMRTGGPRTQPLHQPLHQEA